MKFWVQVVLLLFTSCQHPVFADLAAKDPNPGLNFTIIETYFKPVKCFEFNFELAMTCAEGLNSALKLVPDGRELIGEAEMSARYELLKDYGPVKLAREITRLQPATYQEALQLRDRKLQALEEGVKALIGKTPPFDYRAEIRGVAALVPTGTPESKIVLAALDGQLKSRDAHAFLMTHQDFEEFQGSNDPGLIGVGVTLHPANRAYRFQRVIASGGGAQAGLKDRDLLLEIDGQKIGFDLSSEEVVKRLRGPEGSVVTLKIERAGQPLIFKVTRRPFRMKNIESRFLPASATGVVRIERFAATGDQNLSLCTEVDLQLHDLQEDGAKNFVLDLRDNPGGFIDQAICILSLFTGPDQVAVRAKAPGATSAETVYRTSGERRYTGGLVVLINEASASASELLAGAVQDLGAGWVVGKRSFGKGSLQDFNAFTEAPGEAVEARTVQLFYQPNGRTNQGEGIFPDLAVDAAPGDDEWVPREFDLFPKALRLEKKTPEKWVTPRPQALQKLTACVQARLSSESGEDPQLARALTALGCNY
ncbi:MAG: hypothetical protein KF767_14870 [Bdellovibrionaceae bacterium]|nr:hypothetical protein [Pseudobdellovibrionaceae bacterium]